MAGPAPAVARARRELRGALTDLAPGALVLVACSGGADSLALAATASFVARRDGWQAGAVIVDHGLRPGSAQVAERAAQQCRELGLDPVMVRRASPAASASATPGRAAGGTGPATSTAGSAGPEGAARQLRYALLSAAAAEHGAESVLLGHTLDDQAETVLLRLARGSGARSLAGIPPRRGHYRRPFLELRRGETEDICRALGLTPDRDETNEPDGPWRAADGSPLRRAAVRATALPALTQALGPGVPEALARTARQLARDADLLDHLAAELFDAAQRPDERGIGLDVATLTAAHPALRTRALHAAALQAGASSSALAAVHVDELEGLLMRYHGQGPIPLPGGITARRIRTDRGCGRLILCRSEHETT